MKVLTAEQMREVDRRTIEAGIPGLVLMENAGHRVLESMERHFAPLASHRIAVLCGKGNNGGDGLVVARQLWTRVRPRALWVILLADPAALTGDAAANYRMLRALDCPVLEEIPPAAHCATLVVDALLGTGLTGSAHGRALDGIRAINGCFPSARVVAVDVPSGIPSDTPLAGGEFARADLTVTFTAPKVAHVLPPNCDAMGELEICAIGSPSGLCESAALELIEPAMFPAVLEPRPRAGHKGTFGHVLVVGGSRGKTGAAAMAGLAALRAGAGLVTVASVPDALAGIGALSPELMTEAFDGPIEPLAEGKSVVAIGPGLGRSKQAAERLVSAVTELEQPVVLDADALEPGLPKEARGRVRVLTPHPGEMARLTGMTTAQIQLDRAGVARRYATSQGMIVVLKGQRTLIAFPDGQVWVNPTGTPAMGTGGAGDILTGMVAGLLAQFPALPQQAIAAAVYLHGLSGEIGVRFLGEKSLIATDLLDYLPTALEECANLYHRE